MALAIGGQLADGGRVRRGYLGVRMSEMDPDLVELYGLDLARPVIINGIEPGSPAEAGRFMEQDIVLEFAGQAIRSKNDLVNAIAAAPIGEEIIATVYRTEGDAGRIALTVVLVDQADAPALTSEAPRDVGEERTLLDTHGLAFSDAPSSSRSARGAVVSRVRKGSAADEAGLREGDVITQVEDTAVSSGSDAVAALRASKRPFVPLKFERKGESRVTSLERPRR
jgi:serine protease Do